MSLPFVACHWTGHDWVLNNCPTPVGGVRSLLARWMGGAASSGARPAGLRGFLAFWMGGASSLTPTAGAGFRGLAAFWMGGASSLTPTAGAGFRGLAAFWMGGASMLTPTMVVPTVHGGDDRLHDEDYIEQRRLRRRTRMAAEDSILLRIVVTCVTEGLLE
jgi:hypothetical protein